MGRNENLCAKVELDTKDSIFQLARARGITPSDLLNEIILAYLRKQGVQPAP